MKKLLLIFLFFSQFVLFAQSDLYLWPIKDMDIGENILFKPQDYIEQESNYDRLIIHAPKGSIVQSPIDGEIIFFRYVYYTDLNSSMAFKHPPENFEKDSRMIEDQGWDNANSLKFLSVAISIKADNGKVIYISGLRPIKNFKTGERIAKGNVIGTVGFFYSGIDKPSISISISENGKSSDPMSPFGLKSTFKRVEQKNSILLSKEEAQFDFEIFVNALKEGHPGLYDYIAEEEFNNHVSAVFLSINSPIHISDFERVIISTISKIRDSHLSLLSPSYSSNNPHLPTISIGWLNDTLIANRVLIGDEKYYGKEVVEVDGIAADSLKQIISYYLTGSDGYTKSFPDFNLLTIADLKYFQYVPGASKESSMTLKFVDGEKVFFKGHKIGKECVNLRPLWKDFYLINQYKQKYSLEKLSDTTAYLGLGTFDLTEVEMERIAAFVDSISDYSHLIIDVRNNYGGNLENLEKIFSYIAQQPFKLSAYSFVKKQGDFDFFEYCLNYDKNSGILFPDYIAIPEKEEFFLYNNNDILPDTSINFKGKVYVLINERSFSASTVLAGLVSKYKRGITIGRETGSTYCQMNALTSANLRLPNSNIDIRIPLVKIVFDDDTNPKFPYGRGVLPDYPVAFSLDELSFKNGDSILNYAKQIIQDGLYIKEIYVEGEETITSTSHISNTQPKYYYYLILFIGACGICISTIYFIKRKKTVR